MFPACRRGEGSARHLLGNHVNGGLQFDDSDVVLQVAGVEVRVGVEASHVGVEVFVELCLAADVPFTHADLQFMRLQAEQNEKNVM